MAAAGELSVLVASAGVSGGIFSTVQLNLNDPDGAMVTYTQILTHYPGSLLLPEVRLRIRALRGDGV